MEGANESTELWRHHLQKVCLHSPHIIGKCDFIHTTLTIVSTNQTNGDVLHSIQITLKSISCTNEAILGCSKKLGRLTLIFRRKTTNLTILKPSGSVLE